MNWHTLKTVANDLLFAELDTALKQAMDDKLSIGMTHERLWEIMQAFMFEGGLHDGQVIYTAVYAYLFPECDHVPPYPENWSRSNPPSAEIVRQTRS